jgi:ketosteroid isomerase-like protein
MTASQGSNLSAETETLKEVYAAINRNDIPAAVKFFDPQIERIEPEGFPAASGIHGLAGVQAHFSQGRETWAEGSCNPEQFIVAGNRIIVLIHVRVKLKVTMEWIEGRLADVFTFRDGKIIQMRTFAERQQALEWTGIKDSNTD